MLDIKFIKENKDLINKNCENRNVSCDIKRLLELDDKRRELIVKIDELKMEKNRLNEILKSGGDKKGIIKRGKQIKNELEKNEPELEKTLKEWKTLLMQIPNITHSSAPIGRDESENKEIEKYGEPPKFDFKPKSHEELMEKLDLIDFKRAAKVSGSKFYYLKNKGVLLELSLIKFAFDKLITKGFIPFITPDLAKDEILEGIGFNSRGPETQVYSVENSDLSLIGTAEITMGGYHKDEIILENKLPLKYAALSHCFRTEAGGYGKYDSGLYRVHQFSKVEMFVYSLPEDSEKIHTELKDIEVEIFKDLGIPFRVIDICTGDLGSPAYRKYDLEVWMISKNGWGEVTSTSDTTTYQSRRLNIKVKRKNGTKEFVHMLNGTAIAIPRAIITILENYQQKDGSILMPEVLHKYLGFKKIGI